MTSSKQMLYNLIGKVKTGGNITVEELELIVDQVYVDLNDARLEGYDDGYCDGRDESEEG